MDELTLKRWKESFENELQTFQIEYDSFLLQKELHESYLLELDSGNQWTLKLDKHLPRQVRERLEEIFFATKPG